MKLDLEREFAENTTLHGIVRIFQSVGVIIKLLWTVVFLVAVGLFAWQISERFGEYFRYNYNTVVKVEHKPNLTFPGVTICNYNRFDKSRISSKYGKHLDKFFNFANVPEYYYYDYYKNEVSSQLAESSEDWLSSDDFDFEQFAEQSGFRLNDSLLRCEWKGKHCNADSFSVINIPNYGVCYQFKTYDENENRRRQILPGAGNGLSVLIDISQDDYSETFKQGHHEAGLKLIVHDRYDQPLVETLGLAISPGFHTYAAVRKKKYESLPKPWGNCISKKHGYSKNSCLVACRLEYIIRECHCRPLGYRYIGEIELCTPEQQSGCVTRALQKYRSSIQSNECVCPTPCVQVEYTTSLSMTYFPSDTLSFEYQMKYKSDRDDQYLRKNLVYLDVYFDELSETKFKQVEAMSWSALLSDLGGQMGLFLGMSVITAAEVVEYLVRKMAQVFKGAKNKNRVIELTPGTS